jgi:hypothetical protein
LQLFTHAFLAAEQLAGELCGLLTHFEYCSEQAFSHLLPLASAEPGALRANVPGAMQRKRPATKPTVAATADRVITRAYR